MSQDLVAPKKGLSQELIEEKRNSPCGICGKILGNDLVWGEEFNVVHRACWEAHVKAKSTFTPSRYQQAIFDWITNGTGNAIIDAVAGSGKTTTLVQAAALLGDKSGLFVAFNKHIAEELGKRLAGTSMVSSTIHSMCKRVLDAHLTKPSKPEKGNSKWREIIDGEIERCGVERERAFVWGDTLKKLISKVMVTLTPIDDEDRLWALVAHFGLEDDVTPNMIKAVARAIRKAEKITQESGAINFDEMIYWCVKWDLQPTKYDFVMVDEAQDLNAMQQEMVLRCANKEGRFIFCGDGRQALYGFAGADAQSFATIQARTNATMLPLSVNYRCPKSHLALVRDIVPHIEDGPNAIEGVVRYLPEKDMHTLATPGDFVVCRLNAPLVGGCIQFIKNRKAARVLGRDIGKDLINLLEKVMKGKSYSIIVEALEAYLREQIGKLKQKPDSEDKIQSITDRIECLQVCATEFNDCTSLDELKKEIEKLFGDEDNFEGVTFMTVHKGKGLETNRVFVLVPEKLPLSRKGQTSWQKIQELNLRYVALTRAKKELVILGELPKIQPELPQPIIEDGVAPKFIDMPKPEEDETAITGWKTWVCACGATNASRSHAKYATCDICKKQNDWSEVEIRTISEPAPIKDDFVPHTPQPEFVEAAIERWDAQTLRDQIPHTPESPEEADPIEVETVEAVVSQPQGRSISATAFTHLCSGCGSVTVKTEGDTCPRCKEIFKARSVELKPTNVIAAPTAKDSALRQIVDGLSDTEIDKLLELLLTVKAERKSA